MKTAENNICPRCTGPVPDEEHKGQFPGALSRVADVEICSMCGQDEAVALLLTEGKENGMVPQKQWPIDREVVVKRMSSLFPLNNRNTSDALKFLQRRWVKE